MTSAVSFFSSVVSIWHPEKPVSDFFFQPEQGFVLCGSFDFETVQEDPNLAPKYSL
jgi:hypothetical protein